jgi:hypothetical protein
MTEWAHLAQEKGLKEKINLCNTTMNKKMNNY